MNNDCDTCKKVKENPPAILKCSSPNSSVITTVPVGTPTPFTVATRALNKCGLSNSKVLLEFASNIIINEAFTGTIIFQVYKTCNNQVGPIPIGPAWVFSATITETLPSVTETFSFFVCDSNCCNDECCIYTVVATITATVVPTAININNATLSAIVSG
ncbi:DUF4489 domain-containing protein [Clostridium sp. BL-8]|uniref:DUF4489 domain-containing protein n=1 Tax=Clostridium sp. BL-8 TaxID=349938 RepID=UPI00098BE207|nr:DUF4489 domain-containing protein [Clostridium sp. BL-8]OOM71997.1 hypothetical protein CLOBL_48940 [Clostridium sp. BL-8]